VRLVWKKSSIETSRFKIVRDALREPDRKSRS